MSVERQWVRLIYNVDPVMGFLSISTQKLPEELKKVPQLKRSISAIIRQDIECCSPNSLHNQWFWNLCSCQWWNNLYGATIATVGNLSFSPNIGEKLKSNTWTHGTGSRVKVKKMYHSETQRFYLYLGGRNHLTKFQNLPIMGFWENAFLCFFGQKTLFEGRFGFLRCVFGG